MRLKKVYLIVGIIVVLAGIFSILRITAIQSAPVTLIRSAAHPQSPTSTVSPSAAPSATVTASITFTPTPLPSITPTATTTPTRIPTSQLTALAVPPAVDTGLANPIVVYAAGDIAECNGVAPDKNTGAMMTSKMLLKTSGPIFTLGDNSNDSGTKKDYDNCYNPTWGRLLSRTYPVMGNHDASPDNQGSAYFSYFDGMTGVWGHYSLDLGSWHIILLNAECGIGGQGCYYGSPQEKWLRADLAATRQKCIMALWHQPLFTSGGQAPDRDVQSFWFDLYNYKADVILNGHNHMYERFVPLNPFGVAASNGIRQFVVGTGGAPLEFNPRLPSAGEVIRDNANYGYLKLTLLQDSYQWQFVPKSSDTSIDSGAASCHR